jgi:hypothetical protein
MAYPTAIDSFTNPAAGNNLNSPSHSTQHINTNAAVTALETKVGIDSSADTNSIDYKLSHLLTTIYPIGSIYISVVSTNPATLFSFGTWVAFGTGQTLVGIDAGQTEFNTVEKTGGEKTHTLVSGEMPAHTHTFNTIASKSFDLDQHDSASGWNSNNGGSAKATTDSTGTGSAHNNLQPYIVTYMWKRTA